MENKIYCVEAVTEDIFERPIGIMFKTKSGGYSCCWVDTYQAALEEIDFMPEPIAIFDRITGEVYWTIEDDVVEEE